MQATNIKKEAFSLLERLPEKPTMEDLIYQLYIRQAIEAGLEKTKSNRFNRSVKLQL